MEDRSHRPETGFRDAPSEIRLRPAQHFRSRPNAFLVALRGRLLGRRPLWCHLLLFVFLDRGSLVSTERIEQDIARGKLRRPKCGSGRNQPYKKPLFGHSERGASILVDRELAQFPPGNQLDVFLRQQRAKLRAGKKIKITHHLDSAIQLKSL